MKPTNELGQIYSLLPAIFRTRDSAQGYPLEAFFQVLETQYGIVRENLRQLYDDQFIETCAPWVIPYLGELIGFNPRYTVALSGLDSRAEVANTIGYRRRKGTLIALEQVTRDVSGRTTIAVEEFKRLVTTLSLRDVRPHHFATASLRRGRDLAGQRGPFTRLNHTIDVRRIAPRVRPAQSPDSTPLDIDLHGGGRFNINEVAVWIWRWQSRPIENAPAFPIGPRGYFFSSLGGPIPLFQLPPMAPLRFTRLIGEADAPQPISRQTFGRQMAQFYPASLQLIADGQPVDLSQIVCANLTEGPGGAVCHVPAGKIAIDPELGRIQYAQDLIPPVDLRVNYSYGSPAEMAGGPYDRTASLATPDAKAPSFTRAVGTDCPTVEAAVDAWNSQPPGTVGQILLPNYESFAIDLTGIHSIRIPTGSELLIASARSPVGPAPEFSRSCVTLRGKIEVAGLPAHTAPGSDAPPMGQLRLSGIRLLGNLRLSGNLFSLQILDSTLTPGQSLTTKGDAVHAGEPSVSGSDVIGASVCLIRTITGPIALPASCSVRLCASILDSSSPYCAAYAGPDLASPGAQLHVEDSTIIGRVYANVIRLASNTIFHARLGRRDPWKAPVWAARRQTGCVRFCWVPFNSLTPTRYECLPPDQASQAALEPEFVTLRFGEPGYCLLSGDCPMAIWNGADNGSQMGVYLQIQETEAVANVGIRSQEYLPANLERGVFLIPSRTERARPPGPGYGYGYGKRTGRCAPPEDTEQERPFGIGVDLI